MVPDGDALKDYSNAFVWYEKAYARTVKHYGLTSDGCFIFRGQRGKEIHSED
jgi:hypothetical protein